MAIMLRRVAHFFNRFVLLLVPYCSGYPGGAPDLACSTMFPTGHSAAAQTSKPPYKIVAQKSAYIPGETIGVDIYGVQADFIGVYVQPRLVGCHVNTTRTVGVFTASDPRLQTRHCFGVIHSTVTHTSKVKKNHVALLWTAPVRSSGHVVIKATIVKDKETFWVDVDSPPLIDLQTMDTPTCMSHTHRDGFKFDHKNNRYEANKLTDSAKESSSSRPQWHFILLLIAVLVRGVIHLL